jgi:hypothetical protein
MKMSALEAIATDSSGGRAGRDGASGLEPRDDVIPDLVAAGWTASNVFTPNIPRATAEHYLMIADKHTPARDRRLGLSRHEQGPPAHRHGQAAHTRTCTMLQGGSMKNLNHE